jgi:hypothetical protein
MDSGFHSTYGLRSQTHPANSMELAKVRLRLIPQLRVAAPEVNHRSVLVCVILFQPEQLVNPVHCPLHDVLQLGLRDVRVFGYMSAISIQQQNIAAGDWEQLAKVLRNSGMSEPELDELSTAITEDGQSMGSKVKGWISKNAPRVLSGGVKIGAAIGQTLLTEYLKRYCGLP